MSMLDLILQGIGMGGNIIGALQSEQMNREDRKYWQNLTANSLQDIDAFRDQGQVDLQNLSDTLRPGYDRLAADWSQGAQSLSDQGTKAWDDFYGDLMGGYKGGSDAITGLSSNRISGLGGELSSFQSGMDKAYGDRLTKGMGMLEGLGNQAKSDIRRDYADKTQSELSRLGSVGLGNTSAGSVMQRGMAESQSNDMNRLNENLRREQFNAYSGLSGDQLSSRSGLGQFGIGMMDTARSQDLSQQERMLNAGAELMGRYGSDALNAKQNLGEFNLSNQVAASQAQLGTQERLALQPFNFMQDMLDRKIAASKEFGLPPEIVPAALTIGQNAMSLFNVRQTSKGQQQDSGTPFSFGFSF